MSDKMELRTQSHTRTSLRDTLRPRLQKRLENKSSRAACKRPSSLEEYISDEHIVGPGKLLRRAIEADKLFSPIILWGRPGTSKTTMAQVIATRTRSHFETLSAVLAEAELNESIDPSNERRRMSQKKTTFFVTDVLDTLTWS
jgi:putative ATPase